MVFLIAYLISCVFGLLTKKLINRCLAILIGLITLSSVLVPAPAYAGDLTPYSSIEIPDTAYLKPSGRPRSRGGPGGFLTTSFSAYGEDRRTQDPGLVQTDIETDLGPTLAMGYQSREFKFELELVHSQAKLEQFEIQKLKDAAPLLGVTPNKIKEANPVGQANAFSFLFNVHKIFSPTWGENTIQPYVGAGVGFSFIKAERMGFRNPVDPNDNLRPLGDTINFGGPNDTGTPSGELLTDSDGDGNGDIVIPNVQVDRVHIDTSFMSPRSVTELARTNVLPGGVFRQKPSGRQSAFGDCADKNDNDQFFDETANAICGDGKPLQALPPFNVDLSIFEVLTQNQSANPVIKKIRPIEGDPDNSDLTGDGGLEGTFEQTTRGSTTTQQGHINDISVRNVQARNITLNLNDRTQSVVTDLAEIPGEFLRSNDKTIVPAFQAKAGIQFHILRNMGIHIGYRFFKTTDISLNTDFGGALSSLGGTIESDGFESHHVDVGLRWYF